MGQYLGQHFLKNQAAVQKIIAALELSSGETVIEIGPGTGALTFPLLTECKQKNCKLIGIERDAELAHELQKNAEMAAHGEVMTGDALNALPEVIARLTPNTARYKLVGNIPYYITGALLRLIGELPRKPAITVLMIQKEVALRAAAKPPHMNLLAGAVQFWGDVQTVLSLTEQDFDPPPKVKSAVVKIIPTQKSFATSEPVYYEFLKIAFKQPRKLLLNNLAEGFDLSKPEVTRLLNAASIKKDVRAQNLSVAEIASLASVFSELTKRSQPTR